MKTKLREVYQILLDLKAEFEILERRGKIHGLLQILESSIENRPYANGISLNRGQGSVDIIDICNPSCGHVVRGHPQSRSRLDSR